MRGEHPVFIPKSVSPNKKGISDLTPFKPESLLSVFRLPIWSLIIHLSAGCVPKHRPDVSKGSLFVVTTLSRSESLNVRDQTTEIFW